MRFILLCQKILFILFYQKIYFIGKFDEKYSWYLSLKIAFRAIKTKMKENQNIIIIILIHYRNYVKNPVQTSRKIQFKNLRGIRILNLEYFLHIFLVFFMLILNLYSYSNYHEQFARYFNCSEPHNQICKKFKNPP